MTQRPLLLLVLALTVLSTPCIFAEDIRYSLKDLQALDQRQSYDELLAHLQDVPPAQRNADYDQVVKHACLRPGQIDPDIAQYCFEPLHAVLVAQPADQDFAWKAGKWARRNLAPWTAAPYFAAAITKPGDARCNDDDVQVAIVSGLDQSGGDTKDLIAKSQHLAFATCWPAMQPAIMKKFNAGPASGYLDNVCPALQQKKTLTGLRAKTCEHLHS